MGEKFRIMYENKLIILSNYIQDGDAIGRICQCVYRRRTFQHLPIQNIKKITLYVKLIN